MRSYKGAEIMVGDPAGPRIKHVVEMWRDGNIGSVYSESEGIYHGYICGALGAFDEEVKRITGLADRYGFEYEVIEHRA